MFIIFVRPKKNVSLKCLGVKECWVQKKWVAWEGGCGFVGGGEEGGLEEYFMDRCNERKRKSLFTVILTYTKINYDKTTLHT